MASAHRFGLTRPQQLRARVLAHRLQQVIARRPAIYLLDQHQGFIHQARQQIQHILLVDPIPSAYRLRGVECPPAGKGREPAQQRALAAREQVIAPIDQRALRLLARQRRPAATSEQAEAVVEPLRHLLHRHRTHPGRGQLQRQRNAIQPAADLGNDGRVPRGQREAGQRGGCSLLKEARRFALCHLLCALLRRVGEGQ